MRRTIEGLLLLAAVAAAQGGCDQGSQDQWNHFWGVRQVSPDAVGDAADAPVDRIALAQFAARLNLRIERSTTGTALLTDRANRVLLTADPGGSVSVNAVPIESPGPIGSEGGRLYVSASLVPAVKARLRRAASAAAIAPSAPAEPTTVDGVNIIEVHPKRSPRLGPVLIDPGHGGKDDGASGYVSTGFRRRKIAEKDVNLATALEVARLLQARNVRTVLTRSDDRFIDKYDRARQGDRLGVKLMVSIHADAADGNTRATGYTVYLAQSPSRASAAAARAIDARLNALGIARRGVRKHPRRIVVLNNTRVPAVLIEQGFLSNALEAARLNDPTYRARLAGAIAQGIVDFLQAQ